MEWPWSQFNGDTSAYGRDPWSICVHATEYCGNQKHESFYMPRLKSSRPISPLRRTLWLDELLRLRRIRDSAGSVGLSPLARACKLRMSVKLMTPTRRPDNRAPSSAEEGVEYDSGSGAGTLGEGREPVGVVYGATGVAR